MNMDTTVLNFKDVGLVAYLTKTINMHLTHKNDLTQLLECTKAYVQMDNPSGTPLQSFVSNDNGSI